MALFEAAGGNTQRPSTLELSKLIEGRLGIPTPHCSGDSEFSSAWVRFISKVSREDLLDLLTIVARSPVLERRGSRSKFIGDVEVIFREMTTAYEMDPQGGVHPRIDLAFSVQRAAVLQGLHGPEYEAARQYLEECVKALRQSSPDGAEAIRDIFLAIENVFRQMFLDQQRLTLGGVSNRLRPLIKEVYPEGTPEHSPCLEAASSFGSWVQASHGFRHEQPQHTVNQPPEELYYLLVTQGFSFLRWLAHLHRIQKASRTADESQ